MNRAALPWILLTVVVLGAGAALLLRGGGRDAGPADGEAKKARAAPQDVDPAFLELLARERAAGRERRARDARDVAAARIMRGWLETARTHAHGHAAPEELLHDIRTALAGKDEGRRLAALRAVHWVASQDIDKAAWRTAILPQVHDSDDGLRLAALQALLALGAHEEDASLWVEEARRLQGPEGDAEVEAVARGLTRLGGGRIQGDLGDAVLHLLDDETRLSPVLVLRGLQMATWFEPRVEKRILDIVRVAKVGTAVRFAFFHQVAAHLEPKSDAVVDLLLQVAATGGGELATVLRALGRGLSPAQVRRVADALLVDAEGADSAYTLNCYALALVPVARREQAKRLEALLADDTRASAAGEALRKALAAARARP
jgi:hypothetical protein